ncbi:hypothetical protein L9F63_012672 [Diploptera punctata]|uniref:Uncharacterized protein n=1 Tax=Diploptera punctata TaxID=6984 RepID=A0AAD8EML3_DIPPU|nr:hypothetical protein L9F63_012672 [Diploptera punctata]
MAFLLNQVSQSSSREKRDTYLDAYAEMHGDSLPPIMEYIDPSDVTYPNAVYTHDADFKPYSQQHDLEYEHHTLQYYSKPHVYSSSTGPATVYGPPSGPATVYGPPSGPNSVYGPPSGPPAVYGPPHPPTNGPQNLLSKGLEFGFSFATLCKILLKVLIFKMIVKFIAVICLLLFFPKFDSGSSSSNSSSDSNDSDRAFISPNEDVRLNDLTRIVLESVDKNSRKQMNKECVDDVRCRISRLSQYLDKHYTIHRLLNMFVADYEINNKTLR